MKYLRQNATNVENNGGWGGRGDREGKMKQKDARMAIQTAN